MAINVNSLKIPSIKIYFDKNCIREDNFKELLLGIEEEGIPYEIHGCDDNNAVVLGYKASLDSNLGVGVGVSKENMVLHYNKLDEDTPIYIISTKSTLDKIRSLGANAARLVIRMPFKEI